MRNTDFYRSVSYRTKQSAITRLTWKRGLHDFLRKRVLRKCERSNCIKTFSVIPSNPKKYCSSSCSAIVGNQKRVLSESARKRISQAISKSLLGRPSPYKGKQLVPRSEGICQNINCQKTFKYERWKKRKFCSAPCAIKTVGSRPTSPRAARVKAGIRSDIDPKVYFFSRWEANYARILNLQGIKWIHQPRTFQLKSQKYTPDFYLPQKNVFVEIKNFLSEYSMKRDAEFRVLYPEIKLKLILKDEYLKLQERFASQIKTWEYS